MITAAITIGAITGAVIGHIVCTALDERKHS